MIQGAQRSEGVVPKGTSRNSMAITNLERDRQSANGSGKKCTEMADEKHRDDDYVCHIEILMERCGGKAIIARRQSDLLSTSYAKADVAINIGKF